jgi:hypothetical protein
MRPRKPSRISAGSVHRLKKEELAAAKFQLRAWVSMTAKQRRFFQQLKRLCAEFGVTITGCGCCGGPEVRFGPEEDWRTFERVNVEAGRIVFRSDR